MVASAVGNPGVVSALVAHGADLNYVSAYRVMPNALSVALEYDIPRQDFTIVHNLLDRGADINKPFPDRDEDMAIEAAGAGQMKIVNELLARGYTRDLPGLFLTLKIRVVNEETEAEKERAKKTVLEKLSAPEEKKNIPALLDKLRLIIGNQHQVPSDFQSPHKKPEHDPDFIALETILKS